MTFLPIFLLGFVAAMPLASAIMSSLFAFTQKPLGSMLPQNSTIRSSTAPAASSWWYAALDHSTGAVRDYAANLEDNNNNPVYDYPIYIAVASGDAAELRNALYSNGPSGLDRDNGWLAGQPRTIYIAPGTYIFSETLYLDTDTVLIGDAANPPTIKAASGFSGDYMIVAGEGGDTDRGGELKFSVMMKNLILDTTANSGNHEFIALSWRVAQNSALVNIDINMPQDAHTGLWMGQGSTIQAGDVSFSYGMNGIWYKGHQQATLKNMKFSRCRTGILIDGGFTTNIFAPSFDTVGRSIVLNSGAPWVSVVDAVSTNSGTFFTSNVGYPNFLLENISKDTTDSPVAVVNGATKIGGQRTVGTYVFGNTYGADPVYQTQPPLQSLSRPTALAPGGIYPVVSANQYASATANDVINLKDSSKNGGQTLQGDGVTNDGPALQAALNTAAFQGKIAYLPYGIYRTFSTITIPSGTRLVGNGWSTISGYGSAFMSESNPTPVVKVGNRGDVGTVAIQDIRFTVGQALPGAIIVQVNMAGKSPGDVAIHNSLITVGGTRDTELNCGSEGNCRAAYLGLHLTSSSSAYIDNFWAWVADHSSDPLGRNQGINSAAKVGVLIEARKGTWITGLGTEHFWLAQLSYNNATNVFMSFFQSESNYFQGNRATTALPAPFNPTSADPSFSWCGSLDLCPMSVAQFFNGGSNIFIYAAASWNFFGGDQDSMNVIHKSPSRLRLYGLTDRVDRTNGNSAHYIMRLPSGTRFGDGSNDEFGGSWGTLVAKYTT